MIFFCPTCHKEYKKLAWAKKHQAKTGHADIEHGFILPLESYEKLRDIPTPKCRCTFIGTLGAGMTTTRAGLALNHKDETRES